MKLRARKAEFSRSGVPRIFEPIYWSGCATRGGAVVVALSLVLVDSAGRAEAQEALRMSLAGAQAAEARRQGRRMPGLYNLKHGPTAWRLGAGLALEYNDNALLEQDTPKNDLIVRPGIDLQIIWPVTEKNALNLDLAAGYSAYLLHPELSRAYITPGSELSFDLYVADFWINLHDRFSINEQSYQDPTVTGTGDYSRMENALGAAGSWDLNKLLIRIGYDHVNYEALSGGGGQPDGTSELGFLSAGYWLNPGTLGGVELGAGLLHYSGQKALFSDAQQWHAGFYCDTQVSEYVHFRGSMGYTDYAPENSRLASSFSDDTGLYAQLELQHRANRYLVCTLSGGRTISFAFYGGAVDLTYTQFQANWRVWERIQLATSLQYEHGAQGDIFIESFDRYGAGFLASREISPKSSLGLSYQFFWRKSNLAGREYLNDVVSLAYRHWF